MPLKIHAVASHSKSLRGKRKLKQVECAVSRKIAKLLSVDETSLSVKIRSSKNKERDEKARDLDCLISRMKEKLAKASSRDKLQILTLVPESWCLRKAGKEFGVSKTTVFKARKLRDQKGIIALPEKCRRQKISNEIIQLVLEFYCNDEFSRQLPGKKDYVSVGRNQHMSKRLILCNLKELYACSI